MGKKIRIGIDFDDTIEGLQNAWLGKMGLACDPPIHLTSKDWTKWTEGDLEPLHGRKLKAGVPLKGGRVTDGTEHFMTGPDDKTPGAVGILEFLTPDLYKMVRPLPGAPEAVAQLAKIPNVEILCVTAHPGGTSPDPLEPVRAAFEANKNEIIAQRYPDLVGKTYFASDKTQFDLDGLIDDGPHNIKNLLAHAQKEGRPFLALYVNTSLNQAKDIPQAVRIDSIAEAPEHVARFAKAVEREGLFQGLERVPVRNLDLSPKTPTKENIK
ncbi:MAG: hypothetical protein PW734_12635 [Verrucomicrobium sp.]|nr:hypothetical protein [Verrucomicrobium sp.]